MPPKKRVPDDEDVDFEEEDTGVGNSPIENIERRTKKFATTQQEALSTLTLIRSELQTAVERDVADHRVLFSGLESVNQKHEQLNQALNDMRVESANKFGELGAQTQTANGKLDILLEDVRAQRRAVAHRERVTIETAAVIERTEIEDKADEKKARRARQVKLLSILGGVMGSGGLVAVLISALLGRC